ncbi:MAG: chorismate mutase [Candidatus Bipolaricaulia bacterium]
MIDNLRTEIDRIDEKLVKLLNRRASKALEIGQHKRKKGWDVTDKEREEDVLNHVRAINSGPLTEDQLERIYQKLISETKEIQMEVDTNDSRNEARSN